MPGFTELGLSSWLVEQCRQLGLKQPTPVQLGCIPAILEGEYSTATSLGSVPASVASLLMTHVGSARQGSVSGISETLGSGGRLGCVGI